METRKITLEELYDFIKAKFELNDKRLEYLESKMDSNFKLVAGRFDQVDSKFEQINDRFEQVNDRFSQIEKRMNSLEEKVQEVYETRDKITMQFNRRVLLGNSVLAGIAAFFVALVTGRYTTS